ncbi:unnamed protein product, partial [Ectocarpus sp. 13 AM-2016]
CEGVNKWRERPCIGPNGKQRVRHGHTRGRNARGAVALSLHSWTRCALRMMGLFGNQER